MSRKLAAHWGLTDPDAIYEALLTRITVSGTCWIWPSVSPKGYGSVRVKGKYWAAHRWFYTYANGAIPEDMTVDHLCFNPSCVNPSHLRLLTFSENSANQRKRYKTHCIHGHLLDEENTGWDTNRRNPSRPKNRFCRTCAREWRRAWRERQRNQEATA